MAPQRRRIPVARWTAKGIKQMLTRMSRRTIKPTGRNWSGENMAKLNEEIQDTNTILRWMIRNTTQEKALKKTKQGNRRLQGKKILRKKVSQSERKMTAGRVKVESLSPLPEDEVEEINDVKIKIEKKSELNRMSRSNIKPSGKNWSAKAMAKLNKEMEKTNIILSWMIENTTRGKAHKKVKQEYKSSQRKKDQKKKVSQKKNRPETQLKAGRVKGKPLSPIPEGEEEEMGNDEIKIEPKLRSSSQFSPVTTPPIVFGPENFYSEEDEILLASYGA